MHEHADVIGLVAGTVRVAIADARQGNRTAARWLVTAGLAERAGIAVPPMLLDEPEAADECALPPLPTDRLPAGKTSTVWEQGDVQVISVIGKRCCYGVLKGEEVKHIVVATKAWRLEKAHAIELAKALL